MEEKTLSRKSKPGGDVETKIYAQALKGYIEIVEASDPPAISRTYLKRPYFDPWLGRSMTRKIPVISFEGGKVIGQFTTRKFGNLTGHTLRPGTVWQLDSKLAEQLVEKKEK